MDVTRPALVSEEEFLALPETTERVELIDGEVIVSPSPSPWHQELLRRLAVALDGWSQSHAPRSFIGIAPLDVRFAPGRILQPDLFVMLEAVELDRSGPLERVPELCVEILSTNRAYDRLTKRHVYASAGVRELWIVEPSGVIERWWDPGLNAAEEIRATLRSPLLAGFELDLPSYFARRS